MKEQYS